MGKDATYLVDGENLVMPFEKTGLGELLVSDTIVLLVLILKEE